MPNLRFMPGCDTESPGCSRVGILPCVDLDLSKRGGPPLPSGLNAPPLEFCSPSPPRQLVERTAASIAT